VALLGECNAFAENSASGRLQYSTAKPIITQACINQDKPPCVFETRYIPEQDGTNATKVELAYPILEFQTNQQNKSTWMVTNVTIPTNNSRPFVSSVIELPNGIGAELPNGTRIKGTARLVSVERLKPTVFAPRSHDFYPSITITEPKETVTSLPVIQVKGSCDNPLRQVVFDLVNSSYQLTDQAGIITDSDFDLALWKERTNYFQCFDIPLEKGTNKLRIRCEDINGHWVKTNLVVVLRLDQDRTPPTMSVQWPVIGQQISGHAFTVYGQIDDSTATVTGRISVPGRSKTVQGEVERQGRFWVDDIPILGKTNLLTLVATDATGNSTYTNLTIIQSDTILTIDPVPVDQLWQIQVTVTGRVDPPEQHVWLNGNPAQMNPDGSWTVSGIALNNDGVAVFMATAIHNNLNAAPESDVTHLVTPLRKAVSISTELSSSPLTLNASQPTYGAFNVHLTGTAGRDFVLCVSTNLVDWTPVLTNLNSKPTFDYTDTNSMAYGCRFFRVITTPSE